MHGAVAPLERTANDLTRPGTQGRLVGHYIPDDVLLEVFDFYRSDPWGPKKTGWVWPWPLLAQVCRRWHQIILSSPKRLRMDFFLALGAPVVDILPRLSTETSLVIDYWKEEYDSDHELVPWSTEDIDSISLVFEQPDRIREISICGTDDDLEDLFKTMTGPLPKLESLDVTSSNWTSPDFPDNFLGGRVPALRKLKLTGILPPLPFAPFLVHFDLDLESGYDVDISSLDTIVDRLCEMSQLETLSMTVSAVVIDEPPLDLHDLPPFKGVPKSLLMLSEIHFMGSGARFEALIRRIAAPRLELLCVSFDDKSTIFIPSLPSFISYSTKLHSTSAMVQLELSHEDISVKTYSSAQNPTRSPVSFAIRSMDSGSCMASIASLCHALAPAFAFAEKLIISYRGPGPDDPVMELLDYVSQLSEILGMLAGVRHMAVENVSVPAVVRALGQSSGVKLLPNLQDLRLLFYSGDDYDLQNLLAELKPFIKAHSTYKHALDVCCRMVSSHRQHPELRHGGFRGSLEAVLCHMDMQVAGRE
ncbi:hypothetical protein BC834DRAFT_668094 [Gloeopeniophorella convolvens]|nr:hypothetical protein BC834DRAFT_668094 [Gloeopeniophorella convolvens]